MSPVVKPEKHDFVLLRFSNEDVSNHGFGNGVGVLASNLWSKIISEAAAAGADDGSDPICSFTRSVPVAG